MSKYGMRGTKERRNRRKYGGRNYYLFIIVLGNLKLNIYRKNNNDRGEG